MKPKKKVLLDPSAMGKKGGPARAKKLTKKRRKAIASQGGKSGGRGRK